MLQFYDSDKKFPTWGFGARPIDGPVSHCFNLNGSSNYCEVILQNPTFFSPVFHNCVICSSSILIHVWLLQVEGIQGIMMAYTSALFNVSLAGPTLFGPVISTAAHIASQSLSSGGRKYFVLLIITVSIIFSYLSVEITIGLNYDSAIL